MSKLKNALNGLLQQQPLEAFSHSSLITHSTKVLAANTRISAQRGLGVGRVYLMQAADGLSLGSRLVQEETRCWRNAGSGSEDTGKCSGYMLIFIPLDA